MTRTLEKDQRIDHNSSNLWTKIRKLTSHFEGYISVIHEQEIFDNKRANVAGKEPSCDNKFRLCKANVECVTHIISSCPFMSARYYLPMRHGMVTKTLFKEAIRENHLEMKPPKEVNQPE